MWAAAPVLAMLATALAEDPPAATVPSPALTEPYQEYWGAGQGARWRFAWLITTHAFLSGLGEPDDGLSLGTYFGVGVPVRSQRVYRQEHGFGYAFDVSYRGFATSASHRHRFAATGLVGKRVALYYQAAFGAAVYGLRHYFEFAGPSFGARVGIAFGRRIEHILSIGADLDVPARVGFGPRVAVPSINLSLLTVGSL